MSRRRNSYGFNDSPPIVPPSISVFNSAPKLDLSRSRPNRKRSKRTKTHKRSSSYDELSKRYQKLLLLEKEAKIRDRIIEENNGWNSELEYIAASVGEKCM